MASSSTYAFFHCHYAFQKFPFFCVTLCVLHALQNATLFHCHYAFQNFPFFWVTLCVLHALQNATESLKRQVVMVQFLSIFFFLNFLNFCWVFQKFPFFLCHSVFISERTTTCATYTINWLVFMTEIKSVYSAVRTGSLNKAVCASYLRC